MTKLKQLWLLTALASVAALAGGYFLLVSPKASKAAALREETKTQEDMNASLQSQIDMLQRQKNDLPRQQAELAKFAQKIPNNPALPALIRSLSDAADNASVELVAISPAEPVAVGLLGTPGGAAGAAPATAAGAAPAAPAPGAVNAAAPAAPTTLPIAAIPITVRVTGHYSELSQWMSEIERLQRAFLVNGFVIEKGVLDGSESQITGDTDTLTLQMSGQLYMTIKAPVAPRAPQPAATTVVK